MRRFPLMTESGTCAGITTNSNANENTSYKYKRVRVSQQEYAKFIKLTLKSYFGKFSCRRFQFILQKASCFCSSKQKRRFHYHWNWRWFAKKRSNAAWQLWRTAHFWRFSAAPHRYVGSCAHVSQWQISTAILYDGLLKVTHPQLLRQLKKEILKDNLNIRGFSAKQRFRSLYEAASHRCLKSHRAIAETAQRSYPKRVQSKLK